VQETRGGITKTLMKDGLPRRGGNAITIPLYVGYKDTRGGSVGSAAGKDPRHAALPSESAQKKPLFGHDCGFLSGMLERFFGVLKQGIRL
jgi:hypothetical protein